MWVIMSAANDTGKVHNTGMLVDHYIMHFWSLMLTNAFEAVNLFLHPLPLAHANQIGLSSIVMHGVLHWPTGYTGAQTQMSVRSGSM